jgi:hypothetical protein
VHYERQNQFGKSATYVGDCSAAWLLFYLVGIGGTLVLPNRFLIGEKAVS